MALEDLTGSNKFITDLGRQNPSVADQRSSWAAHIRGRKNVLLNSFPLINSAVNASHTQINNFFNSPNNKQNRDEFFIYGDVIELRNTSDNITFHVPIDRDINVIEYAFAVSMNVGSLVGLSFDFNFAGQIESVPLLSPEVTRVKTGFIVPKAAGSDVGYRVEVTGFSGSGSFFVDVRPVFRCIRA